MRRIPSGFVLTLSCFALLGGSAFAPALQAQGGVVSGSATSLPPDTVRAKNSVLHGIVINAIGQPVPGVEVMIAGTNVRTVSDARGNWSFVNPPGGVRVLHARMLGWVPLIRTVRIQDNVTDTLPLAMQRFPNTLGQVEVRASMNNSSRDAAMMAERLMQLRVGTGKLFTREDVLLLQPYSVADLVRTVVGVDVVNTNGSVRVTTRRAGTGAMQIKDQGCELQFYLDGHAIDGDMAAALSPLQFQSVEVHPQNTLLTGIPSYPNRCGAVVITTLRWR